MHSPCATRSSVNVVRSGADASSAVGMDRIARLTKVPVRRSMCRLKNATPRLASAIPKVLAFTAKPMAAGATP